MRRVVRVAAGLVRACHPEPTAAVTAMATALAATTGRSAGGVVAVAAAVLSGQLSIGWLNDALDADRDAQVGRTDKPLVTGVLGRRTVATAAVVAAVACVPLSLLSGLLAGALHVVATAAGWVYDLGAKATALSVVPYLVCFGLLPVFVVTGLPGAPLPPWWLPAGGALLGAGAHFANVLPDLHDDAVTGVRGLPHRLGAAGSRTAAAVLLLAASVLLASGVLAVGAPVAPALALAAPVVAGAVLGAGLLAGRRAGSRAPFRAVLAVAAIDVALMLLAGRALVG